MFRVVPWLEAIPAVAVLHRCAEATVRNQSAHFPASIRGWAALDGAGVAAASGIVVEQPDRPPALVRLRGPGAAALLDWFEARAPGPATVSLADAPALAERLAATGYRWVEAHLTLRNTAPFAAPPPYPAGCTTTPIGALPVDRWLAFHNAVFAAVPGAVALTADDWARVAAGLPDDATQVIWRGDTLLGFWQVAPEHEDGPSLERLGVAAAARGQGLGRALLRHAQRRLGAPTCTLRTSVGNAAAVALYRAEGYREIDRRDEWTRG